VNSSNWIAVAAVAVSVVALMVAFRNRRTDLEREEEYRKRSRAWLILDRDPGLRTVLALDDVHDDDGDVKTRYRIKLLERTARQLEVAGAPDLGHSLRLTLTHPWGTQTTREGEEARDEFVAAAQRFIGTA
jgi:hypothetical protein